LPTARSAKQFTLDAEKLQLFKLQGCLQAGQKTDQEFRAELQYKKRNQRRKVNPSQGGDNRAE
jgi:hypothetical protein